MSKRIVTSYEWGNTLESLTKALQTVQQYVVEDVPDYAILVNNVGRGSRNILQVWEETLTDGSLVYSVDIYG